MAEKTDIERDMSVSKTEDVKFGEISNETLSPEEDKRLLRKIDRWLLPVMAFSYLFQFLDKSALGFTAIMGIRTDLHLTGKEYSWSSGIYYFGYLVASYPAAMLMVRWKVGKVITMSVLVWGVVLMLTAVTFNSGSLLADRFFLGVTEAPIAPGLTIVVSMWYKRSEQPLRHAAWFLGNTCAGIFGGLLAYAIGHVETIKPWKAVFLIFGAATVAWSVGIFFLLPDTPMEARFLKEEDRKKAILRVKENMTGIKSDKVKWGQVKEALLDVKSWLIVALQLASNIPNGAVTTFSSIVVQGFGFSTFDTLLLGCVTYLLQLVLVLFATSGSSYFRNSRTYFMAFNYAIGVTGAAMVRYIDPHNRWARFAGTVLAGGYSANFPLIMSLMSGNFGGFTKKTTLNAMSFIAYCTGNIIGPQLFFEREAPTYQSGFLALMICLALGFVMCWVIRFYLMWENSRRDKVVSAEEVAAFDEARHGVMVNLTDMTDKEIPQFRYVY
ncbi:major facilitator superfamily transporter [Pochonia chlamydosporia 170]|uniref:Major facilitator superfamily transporter n=1 Tax=Pochonia chlamydosporia 170 TaxID=1380566 RepID=A0A179F4D0_METCM|nr:major facilitator superfamily transporter [Pochonia chlamydosporia 170]OAQ60043.1 major facilitator superfamily transporter [Pochonia chlamydosporia 170]